MRICRYSSGDGVSFGVVEGGPGEEFVARMAGHPFEPIQLTGERHALADVRLVAPLLPSKIIAIGKNYADHVTEMGGDQPPPEPVIFSKPSTAVIGPGEAIAYPVGLTERVDHEGELAIVIGRLCREVPVERAKDVILGYTCANDVTARDLQKRDGQWTRAKGFDTFCPIGPWISTGIDASDLAISTSVNGEVRQDGRTSQLVHDIPTLISYVSSVMTLLPGDVILTGTPAGVGPLQIGDEVSVTIENIGTLTNRVVSRD
ncbi:fumarylacetoacetate hydrolase family protein [Bailinhaonella thermotolerans]|uniref:FAA hydrolase family protein n=1 Tax=Bailinhaonella thermotolerans TaxID=1070861 RepID=A0A3A4A7S0_9ACTN|nr:fumarylacetoacetate hydrolase family protein [Bailinhaonella thermotolerans]RJL25066.1 FAA hydrolase family protein [Bailinhaonella thermotolerans]